MTISVFRETLKEAQISVRFDWPLGAAKAVLFLEGLSLESRSLTSVI